MSCRTPDYTHTIGDTANTLEATLVLDGAAADLTGATVVLVLRDPKSREEETFPMTATDAASGRFTRDWSAGEPGVGRYDARFQATLPGGAVAYSPTNSWLSFRFL